LQESSRTEAPLPAACSAPFCYCPFGTPKHALRKLHTVKTALLLVLCCCAADASESGSPTGSPTAACLDSPTATTAAAQQQQQQQQQRKRQYKVHGMDPYDYWSLIKSL
jgi:hypothetical protein